MYSQRPYTHLKVVNRPTNSRGQNTVLSLGVDISTTGAVTGGRYDENLTYDVRGNIKTLQRYGLTSVAGAPSPTWGMIDNLTYNYGNWGYTLKINYNPLRTTAAT